LQLETENCSTRRSKTTKDRRLSDQALLRFRAGPGAYRSIQSNGFDPQNIGTIAGASGGAKWLVLSQLDRVIVDRILPQLVAPVHLIGSSIGAWRFSCYAQNDPLAAIERFEELYVEQRYSDHPDIDEITDRSRDVLTQLLGPTGVREIVNNPTLRTHVMTVRSGSLAATEKKPTLAAILILAATANILSRRSLGGFFKRGLFYDARDLPPFFDATGFPYEKIELSEENHAAAVLASGAIPLVLRGVRNIPGAPSGVYRDGGIIDYHLDFHTSDPGRLTLYPHFYDHLIPGWFDKRLSWRRNQGKHVDQTLLICPSDEFVAALPNGKIPDRTDFQTMDPTQRRSVWRGVISACRALADDLVNVLDKGSMAARLETL
jgi:hypothetical protein